MARQRIEDLGRICVLLENILEDDLFEEMPWNRPKDAIEVFMSMEEEKQCDLIHDIAYRLQDLEEQLIRCLSISKGFDDLNEE